MFSYKNEKEEGRNPVKFGCGISGGRRRSRSRKVGVDKVEMGRGEKKKKRK